MRHENTGKKITNQQAYQELSAKHVHWDRKDATHIVVWTSGYKTNDCHEIEKFLMRAGMWATSQEYDQLCGKTRTVYCHRSDLPRTMDDVRKANEAAGYHWFEPGAMRFFGSRVGRTLYGDRYFVTSEKDPYDLGGQRRYTIREALEDGSIDTVGEFHAYGSRRDAVAAIRSLLQEGGSHD